MVNSSSKPLNLLACGLGLVFLIAGCSSSDDAAQVINDVIGDETVRVSGTITNINNQIEPGVEVEAVYVDPGDALNPKTTTDDNINENFSLLVLKNTPFFLRSNKSTFATLNSEKGATSVDITGLKVFIPTETEAQDVINLAFASESPQLGNHAWLVVDVEDQDGDQVSGQSFVITSSIPVADSVYTECDGTDQGSLTTVACQDRNGPMYIAYFDATDLLASVTLGSDTKVAPLRSGEITFLDFEVAAAPTPTAFDRGMTKYDADCAQCHAAGSHDTSLEITSAGDLYLQGSQLILALSTIKGMSSVADISQEVLDDLKAFLDDPRIAP